MAGAGVIHWPRYGEPHEAVPAATICTDREACCRACCARTGRTCDLSRRVLPGDGRAARCPPHPHAVGPSQRQQRLTAMASDEPPLLTERLDRLRLILHSPPTDRPCIERRWWHWHGLAPHCRDLLQCNAGSELR